ncbi:MAG: hypothetical protein ACFFBF_17580 [Promethearchaeota archaeon]
MDTKTEILIGIGTAVAAKCQKCLNYLITLARNKSIEEKEIKNAIKIGKRVGLKSIKSMNNYITDVLGLPAKSQDTDKLGPCGCS